MTTTRSRHKPKAAQADTELVTVNVVAPHAVYHDGEQRTGTLHDIPADAAQHWVRHGWARPVDSAAPSP